jgi:hypothetical protein
LRPDEKKRAQDTAFLVPLKNKTIVGKPDLKAPPLPFTLSGEQWACDFRNASVVKLSILDLASFRSDGRVRVDDGHSAPDHLLVGQQKIYVDRTSEASASLLAAKKLDAGPTINVAFQLAFSAADAFRHMHTAVFEAATTKRANGQTITRPKRLTWRLRRCGRIRAPYSAALLDQYTTAMPLIWIICHPEILHHHPVQILQLSLTQNSCPMQMLSPTLVCKLLRPLRAPLA